MVSGCANIQFPPETPRNGTPPRSPLADGAGDQTWRVQGNSAEIPLRSHFFLHGAPWLLHKEERHSCSHFLLPGTTWPKTHLALRFWGTQDFTPSEFTPTAMTTTTLQGADIYSKSLSGPLALMLTTRPAFTPPNPSFGRPCRCANSWASLKATAEPAKAQHPWQTFPATQHITAPGWGT